jgi:ABC-2 type transport system permease protein
MKHFWNNIKQWLLDTAHTFRREVVLTSKDMGVLLFFVLLPLFYPLVYTSIYNPEVTRDMPVAVVDNCRTAESREFIRHADATQAIKICGYASNLDEARTWWYEKRCYGIIEIPENYSKRIGRGEQGVVQFYSDMSLLLRYRSFLESITALQMATDAQLRTETMDALGVSSSGSDQATGIEIEARFLGDPQQGFASFVMPGIFILILQQSMILGIAMLGGASRERRRRNGGIDPLAVTASASASVIGKALCYIAFYIPSTIYVLHFVAIMFNIPHIGQVSTYFLFIVPMLIASAMFGQTLQVFVSERESSFVLFVFTSVAFLFLSGLTWPRIAMNTFMQALGSLVPATWGVEGFIRINNNGAPLALEAKPYLWLWALSILYFITATLLARRSRRHHA